MWTALAVVAAVLAVLYWFFARDADILTTWAAARMPQAGAFAGRVVWLIGASSGIGEALAYECARGGATLVLSARRGDKLEAVAARCRTLGSPKVVVQLLDVEQFESHAGITKRVVEEVGTIDYLVNNAGRSQRALCHETPLCIDQELFRLNVFGVISITKAVLPYMMKQPGGGHIINTSSVAGKTGSPVSVSYSGTKAALQGYFDALRMEMGATHNIRVTNVCPGPVQSEISLHSFTAQPGVKLGKVEDQSSKMPAEKCARYIAGGMWAKLPELWISYQPILFLMYLHQYCPVLSFKIAPWLGAQRVSAFKSGDSGYSSLYKWASLKKLFGGGAGAKAQ